MPTKKKKEQILIWQQIPKFKYIKGTLMQTSKSANIFVFV